MHPHLYNKEADVYPKLDECLVRGVEGDYFLQSYLDGAEYRLTTTQANILHECNGGTSLTDLAEKIGKAPEMLLVFLDKLEHSCLVEYLEEANPAVFPVLGEAPYLQELQIEGTGGCNLWCKHCYARQAFKDAVKGQMTLHEYEKFFDQLHEANVGRVFLSGGEIFTRPDLPDLIRAIASRQIHIGGIFTNGTLYRADVLEALRECEISTSFLVSLDGHTASIHDGLRGSGNFTKTLDFMREVMRQGFKVTINTVLTRQNVKHMSAMKALMEEIGVSRWRISVQREQGEAVVNSEEIEPEWEDVFTAYRELLDIAIENSGKGLSLQLSSVFKSEFLKTKVYYIYRDSNATCEYKRRSLVVNPQGYIMPCPAGIGVRFGNVRTANILDIWKSGQTQMFKTLPIAETECSSCEVRQYCGGGCRVIARAKNGSYLATDPNACPLYFFFRDEVKPRLKAAGVRAKYLDESPDYPFETTQLDATFD